ncbi:O-antigen ligase family protein [Amnibacterium sp. CER49]|uniref:O-antigen ligase family protein n=1 Tax=Amnibacterium sp. CER49 TaxID=3039161 RepID=UPI00244C6256|nr:O-antigen ligase family protein [Amnibacterium sp. CER49]MDH2443011.1 O-antigen ligase family protein [Amnibacterium sp. CER49]
MTVLAICSIEMSNPFDNFQPWNVVMSALAMIAIAIAITSLRRDRTQEMPRFFWPDLVYLAYLLYCALSTLWSVSPLATVVQVVYAGILWTATFVVRTVRAEEQLRMVTKVAVVLAFLSFAAILVFGDGAFQTHVTGLGVPELRGVFNHQQRLGLVMGTVVGLCLVAMANGRFRSLLPGSTVYRRFAFVLLGLAFVAALARLNSVYIIIALVLTLGMTRGPILRVLVGVVVGGLLVWGALNAADIFNSLGSDGVDLSLSGRTNVWERTIAAAQGSGPFGYGFSSFISPVFDAYWGRYRAPHAHDSFLQAYFETGMLGVWFTVAVVLAQLVGAIWVRVRLQRVPYSLFLVLTTLLASLTGVEYAGKPSTVLALTFLVLAAELQEATVQPRRTTSRARQRVALIGAAGSPDGKSTSILS